MDGTWALRNFKWPQDGLGRSEDGGVAVGSGVACGRAPGGCSDREPLLDPFFRPRTLQHPVSTRSPRRNGNSTRASGCSLDSTTVRRSGLSALPRHWTRIARWPIRGAYALGPHVNKPMDAEDVAGAWTALSEAVARRSGRLC